jgi:hypothetical protein
MGLLSAIKSVASKVVSAVKSVVAPAAVKPAPAPTPVAAPKQTITQKVVSVVKAVATGQVFQPAGISGVSSAKQLLTEPKTALTIAAVETAAVVAAVNPTATAALGAKLIPSSLTGKIVVGALAVPAAVAVVSHPSTVTKTVSGVLNVEKNLIKVAAEPNVENVKNLVSENPVIVGGAVSVGSIALLRGATGLLANTGATIANTIATKENTGATEPTTAAGQIPVGTIEPALVPEKAISTNEEIPATTATTTIKTGKKRYRKAKVKQITPSMRQSLQVLINNRNSANRINKNYIKRELLYN